MYCFSNDGSVCTGCGRSGRLGVRVSVSVVALRHLVAEALRDGPEPRDAFVDEPNQLVLPRASGFELLQPLLLRG